MYSKVCGMTSGDLNTAAETVDSLQLWAPGGDVWNFESLTKSYDLTSHMTEPRCIT